MSDYIVMTDTFPGSWGRGATVDEAKANCRGEGPWVVFQISESYTHPRVDGFGRVIADIVPELADTDRANWPDVISDAYRLGLRGKRTPIALSEVN